MSKSIFFSRTCLAGAVLAFSSLAANAGFVTAGYFGTQGAPATINFPPALNEDVRRAVDAFGGATTLLGTQSFENNESSFNYGNGGSASVSAGTPSVINGNDLADSTLGRYNMTTGLTCLAPTPDGCDRPDRGKWLESNASFTYTLTQAVSALAFFGTDFGDFNATISLQLLLDGADINGALFAIQTIPAITGGTPMSAVNGNLIFFGAVGETDDDIFNGFRFNIGQLNPDDPIEAFDFIGIDSLILATSRVIAPPPPPNPVPTPSSLALTGLALALLARFHRRRS